MTITNQDLHVMLARIEERQISLIEKMNLSVIWQNEHERKDEERFSKLNKYAASVAVIASSIGACGAWLWNRLTGSS